MAGNEGKFTILDVTADEAKKLDGGRMLWTPYTIKAGTYPGQSKDTNTVAQPNFLAVNANVDGNHVYLLTKTMYENMPFLQAIHPGAAKYYQEVGLTVPSHLISK